MKKPRTTRSRIKSALRMLWMRSPERSAALKRTGYRCSSCGVKQSKAKGREVVIEVHHVDGIPNWDELIDAVYRRLLCPEEKLKPLCKDCHAKEQ